ncbi:MAG: DinB family protein [Bacilli bacterium]
MTGQKQMVMNVLQGRGAYASVNHIFENLDWRLAGQLPEGSPYTIWQLLNHLIYWQDYTLDLLAGKAPTVPEHAVDSWPGDAFPASEASWDTAVESFLAGLRMAQEAAKSSDLESATPARPEQSRAETLGMLMGHNSYHLGQVVLLRRMLGSWPPPSGGDTW